MAALRQLISLPLFSASHLSGLSTLLWRTFYISVYLFIYLLSNGLSATLARLYSSAEQPLIRRRGQWRQPPFTLAFILAIIGKIIDDPSDCLSQMFSPWSTRKGEHPRSCRRRNICWPINYFGLQLAGNLHSLATRVDQSSWDCFVCSSVSRRVVASSRLVRQHSLSLCLSGPRSSQKQSSSIARLLFSPCQVCAKFGLFP